MYNKLVMVGRVVREIELRYLPNGSAVAKSAIATNHSYKTQSGEKKEETCFLDFDVFGKAAEIFNQYVRRGSQILLEGRLVQQQWTAQDGSKRSKHSLFVETFKFLDSKSDTQNMQDNGGYNQPPVQQQQQQQQQQYQQPSQNNNFDNNYNNNAPQANYGQNNYQEQEVPEINVEDEEIPF
jgi:single-strand DNA-binding protein